MKPNFRLLAVVCPAILLACLSGCSKGNNTASEGQGGPDLKEAVSAATDAYLYGYPLVTMDMTRRQLTNVAPHPTRPTLLWAKS